MKNGNKIYDTKKRLNGIVFAFTHKKLMIKYTT